MKPTCPHCHSPMAPLPDAEDTRWTCTPCRFDWKRGDSDCGGCGMPCTGAFGIPMYEGRVLSNHWLGEWFGRDACERCFRLQQDLPEESDNPKDIEYAI